MPDETLQDAAPAQDAGQPAAQAVSEQVSAPVTDATTATPQDQTGQPAAAKRWAGKYESPEQLEGAFLHSQSEATRMAQRLADLERKVTATTPAATPHFTPEQLRQHKADMLLQLSAAQRDGDQAAAQRYAQTVVWVDDQLANQQRQSWQHESQQQSSGQWLRQEGAKMLQPYAQELNDPSSQLSQKTFEIYNHLVARGNPADEVTTGLAAVAALVASGRVTQGTVQQARQQATQELTQKLKQSVVAGGGGSNTAAGKALSAEQINGMSDQDFLRMVRSNASTV